MGLEGGNIEHGKNGLEAEPVGDPVVGIIMGSDSDLPVMKEAGVILDIFEIQYEIRIVSAHRTPRFMVEYAEAAYGRGLKVIIAGAGGAAHLPGMTAALTTVPVIGVPVESKALKGMDSLLSIAQMPPGIPVATMAINGAKNAGLLAAQFIGMYDPELAQRVMQYRAELEAQVRAKDVKLEELGYSAYLKQMS